MKTLFRTLVTVIVGAGSWATAEATDQTVRGELAFHRHCAACHSLEPGEHRIGPSLQGSYGRAAGQAAGYAYSPALRQLKVRWTDEALDAWLTDAQTFAPGVKMWLKLSDTDERRAVLAFLKSQAARP